MKGQPFVKAGLLALLALGAGGCSHNCYNRGEGCTSTSGEGTLPVPVASVGKVTDGYVSGATVTLDTNDDRICASDEPTTTTDNQGNFKFAAALGQHMVCAQGGYDLTTNEPFLGQLAAPPGATQVTPITALLIAQINALSPPVAGVPQPVDANTLATLETDLAIQLELAGIDLTNADPVAGADQTPALLQMTEAIQTLLQQTAMVIQAAAGGGNATAGNTLTNLLYGHAMNALAAIFSTTPATAAGVVNVAAPLTFGREKLKASAPKVVENATDAAQKDAPAEAAASGLAALDAQSVGELAGPPIGTMTKRVADAPVKGAGGLLTKGQDNPAAQSKGSPSVANVTRTLAPELLTKTAGGGTPIGQAKLADISKAAFLEDTTGKVSAAPPQAIMDSIAKVGVILPEPEILRLSTALAQANRLNNVTSVATVDVNCDTTCVPATLLTDQAQTARVSIPGAFTSIRISLAPLTLGNVVSGGTPYTGIPFGTQDGEPQQDTEQTSPVDITVVPTTATGNPVSAEIRQLQVSIDRVVLYQTTSAANTYVSGALAPDVILTAVVTKHDGTQYTATLSANDISVRNIISFNYQSGSFQLNVGTMLTTLHSLGANFPLLENGPSRAGQHYLVTCNFPGLSLATAASNPVTTNQFSLSVAIK